MSVWHGLLIASMASTIILSIAGIAIFIVSKIGPWLVDQPARIAIPIFWVVLTIVFFVAGIKAK